VPDILEGASEARLGAPFVPRHTGFHVDGAKPPQAASFRGRDGCPQPSHLVSSDGARCCGAASLPQLHGQANGPLVPSGRGRGMHIPASPEKERKRLPRSIARHRTKPNGTAEDSHPYLVLDAPDGAGPSPLVDGRHLQADGRASVFAQRTIKPVVGKLFENVRRPARGARNRKNRREQIGRHPQ
jgi:hypothetical protein